MVRWIAFVVAALLGIVLDLGSKEWAWQHPNLQHWGAKIDAIPGWFDFVRSENQGAAWGLLWGQYTFFLVVSAIAFLAIVYFVHTAPPKAWKGPIVLGLVFAGVAGNFFDRAMYGHVRDFLDAHTPDTGAAHDLFEKVFGRTHWPTFNVADIFICIGAGALVLLFWKDEKSKKPAHPPLPPDPKDQPGKLDRGELERRLGS